MGGGFLRERFGVAEKKQGKTRGEVFGGRGAGS